MEQNPDAPDVDVVIAVHSPSRPIERAVESVLSHTIVNVRVTVVIHNTDPTPVRRRLDRFASDPRLRIEELVDGIPSPAGPMNLGFDLATAPYVSLLGSDDTFEPEAIDSWFQAAHAVPGGADMVIAPARDETGTLVPSPPVRVHSRDRVLHGVSDRLAYRSAPLGLIGRRRFGALRFPTGLQTGEDIPVAVQLWFSGGNVVFPYNAPGYVEHDDQHDRVTFTSRSITEEFRWLGVLLDQRGAWLDAPSARLSMLAKIVRMNVFDALRQRPDEAWTDDAASALAHIAQMLLELDPRVRYVLSRAEEHLLNGILAGGGSTAQRNRPSREHLSELLNACHRLRSFAAMVPRRIRYLLHSQAPLRYHLARLRLQRVGSRRSSSVTTR